jgi:hypothetical protein
VQFQDKSKGLEPICGSSPKAIRLKTKENTNFKLKFKQEKTHIPAQKARQEAFPFTQPFCSIHAFN